MRQLTDFSDIRHRGTCIYCGVGLLGKTVTRDHVPSKAFLKPPYPENLPVVDVCQQCNAGFSKDEEYLSAFLAAVISGTTSLDPERFPVAAKTLARSARLRERIDRTRQVQGTFCGVPEVRWMPEIERVTKVLVKNARGHALFELGLPFLSDPEYFGITPLVLLSHEQRTQFENGPEGRLWAEVGSRMLQRMASDDLLPGGWVIVQTDTYRYAVDQLPSQSLVRMVLHEYLACEVAWGDGSY